MFIGPNNTGKTWFAYMIYALFDRELFYDFLVHTIFKNFDGLQEFDPEYILFSKNDFNNLVTQGTLVLNLENFIDNKLEELWSLYINYFLQNQIQDFFRTQFSDIFKQTKLKLVLDEYDKDLIKKRLHDRGYSLTSGIGEKSGIRLYVSKLLASKNVEIVLEIEKESNKVQNEVSVNRELLLVFRDRIIEYVLVNLIHENLFTKVWQFPAERKSLNILFHFFRPEPGEDLSTEFDFSAKKRLKLKYPKPIIDYIEFLEDAEFRSFKKIKDKKLFNILNLLEEKILKGAIYIRRKSLSREIFFKIAGESTLELNISSTIVKQLAGLDLYLRTLVRKGDLIIIDEPEMNAHPENQAIITEVLSMLVNAGVNVLITTHSPYIVDHLTNLTFAYKLGKRRKNKVNMDELENDFFLKTKNAFLNPANLNVYYFNEKGDIKHIFNMEENDIDWETFSQISDKIINLKLKLEQL